MSKIEKLMVDDTHHADFVDEDYQYEEYKKSQSDGDYEDFDE